jgi:hypothetical protein
VAHLIDESAARERTLEEWRVRVAAAATDAQAEGALDLVHSELLREAKRLKLKLGSLELLGSPAGAGARAGARSTLPRGKRAATQPSALFASKTAGWSGREFVSPGGVPILVGRNRAENERLSLAIGRDDDVWMHVRGSPGAHVLLQMSRVVGSVEPSDECLQMAADLAAFYSELRDESKVSVSTASPRHVVKPNGAKLGAVTLRKEGSTLVGRPQTSALIPSELRALRA